MIITSKVIEVGIIIISFLLGFLSFYVFSNQTKEQKKKQVDELINQLINFVIFIWLAKVLLNFTNFIKDPLPILAYPAKSNAFYLAIVLTSLLLLYKSKRKKLDIQLLLSTFVHVLLISSFVYEFFQFVLDSNTYSFGYLLLLAVLIGTYFALINRLPIIKFLTVIVFTWSIGVLLLSTVQPFVTVFGYIVSPIFILLFLIFSVALFVFRLRKQ